MSDEHAAEVSAASEHAGSFLVKVGNAELVRGISDCGSMRRAILSQEPSMAIYEDLISFTQRVVDSYHWLGHAEVGDLLKLELRKSKSTAELIIDEFEKVLAIQAAAAESLAEHRKRRRDSSSARFGPTSWETVDSFVDAMARLRTQRGHLISLREMRYMDLPRVDELEAEVAEKFDELSGKATEFPAARRRAQTATARSEHDVARRRHRGDGAGPRARAGLGGARPTTSERPRCAHRGRLGLQMDDATARTRILEGISEVFALLNRTRATHAGQSPQRA